MLKDILSSTSVERLKGILKTRYDLGLNISFMKEVSSLEFQEDDISLKGTSLMIPIRVNNHYFATAVVKDASKLKAEEHSTIGHLVKLILEPEFYNWYLSQMTNNSKSNIQRDNIVSIFNPYEFSDQESKEDSQQPANVICLQAMDPNLIPRLSNDIHDISERWAFLRFQDIQEQVKDVNDLKSLGSLTLLIEDVLQLSPFYQNLIHQYLRDSTPGLEPLLIIGSASEVESLEAQGMIHADLAKILKMHRLEVDRLPRDSKLLQETLEIMLQV